MILPIGTSGYNEIQYIRYTSEHIPKLQIHQHSLLIRMVFSWHNSSAQVFVTRSSSNLDHQWIIIIITAPVISIKWCYLSILLVTGSSTEPTLFLAGCRPSLHVGLLLLQRLYLTMGGTQPGSMSKMPAQHSHLTMEGTHPASMSERPSTHIWPWDKPILHPC